MKNTIKAYEELINPLWIRSLIKTEERFIDWCNNENIDDLECTLLVFEKEEMWNDCIIIRNVIQQKQNEKAISNIINPVIN